jgi:hypothetical protein
MDRTEALDEWPDKGDLIESTLATTSTSDTFEDVPRNNWIDSKRKRVRIARMWYKSQDDWYFCTFTGSGFLEDPEISPYKNSEGETESGLDFQSAFITREAERYGVVAPLLSIQDSINHRMSKLQYQLSVRQTFGSKASGLCAKDVKAELARPDGHIELAPGIEFGKHFGAIPQNDMVQGQFALLQEDKQAMNSIGSAAALSGKGPATSGRDLIARQQAGRLEHGEIFDSLRQIQKRTYEWTWNRIQQFWTEEKIIRITDDPKNAKFVELNKPITVMDVLQDQGQEIPPAMQNDPRLSQVVGFKNNLAETNIDIVIDDAPDTSTIVGEQFDKLVNFATSGLAPIDPEDLIEASDLPNKERILERMEERKEAGAQQQQQQQEMIQQQVQIALQQAMADIENTKADTEKKQSETVENMSQARENIAGAVDDEISNMAAAF